jgi:hypothetical protein
MPARHRAWRGGFKGKALRFIIRFRLGSFTELAWPSFAIWAASGVILAVDGAWMIARGTAVAPEGLALAGTAIALLLALGAFWNYVGPEIILGSMALATASLAVFTLAAAVFHYLAATLAFPLVDSALVAFDAGMGFDWPSHIQFLNRHPWVDLAPALAYHSSAAQFGLVVILLSATKRIRRLQTFVQLFALGRAAVVLISVVMPAEGPYAWFRIPTSAEWQIETMGAT